MNVSEDSAVLSSWKDIARYLGKGVRTVQRWERHLGLPVRRPIGASQKSAVVVCRGEVDAWLATHFSARKVMSKRPDDDQPFRSTRSNLKQGIRTAHELMAANHRLMEQIAASIVLLTERCDRLSTQGLEEPWRVGEEAARELAAMQELLPPPQSASSRARAVRSA